jgi:hypothetical protein
VAEFAGISAGASAVVIKLLIARLCTIAGLVVCVVHKTPTVPLTVEERAASVVVRGHRAL